MKFFLYTTIYFLLLYYSSLAMCSILAGKAIYLDLHASVFENKASSDVIKICKGEGISCVHLVVHSSGSVEVERYKELAEFCKEEEIEVILTFSDDFFELFSGGSDILCLSNKEIISDIRNAVEEIISSIDVRGVEVEVRVVPGEDIYKHFVKCGYCREKISSKYRCSTEQFCHSRDKKKVYKLAREIRYDDVATFINDLFYVIGKEKMNIVKFITFDYYGDREIVKFVTDRVKPNAVVLKISNNGDIDVYEMKKIESVISDIHWRKAAAVIACPRWEALVNKLNTMKVLVEQYIFY